MEPSARVVAHFRRGRLAQAAQRANLEREAARLGVSVQTVVRLYGKPPLPKEPESVVYLLGNSPRPPDNEPVKIGYTRHLRNRLETLQSGSVGSLMLLAYLEGGHELEREIHERLWPWRIREDWFEMCDEVREEFRLKARSAA